ncbi:hypothetical protein [Halobacillus salinus]|uniref:hypothetical protein n=1 Tax=Halobacillus salinus TaxID=192814 RepID=UPI0009A649C0|nr:hypothetical protein [Halobacillus salinus]
MSGTVKFNLLGALLGFSLLFLFSLTSNVWQTSVIRGAIGFFSFFLIAFIFRGLWGVIAADATNVRGGDGRSRGNNLHDVEQVNEQSQSQTKETEATAEETSKMIRSLLQEDEESPTITND